MSELIGLLDCNNFFVSCERLFRPDLWGQPVIVLSANDGCVIARSKEVKDRGIPMGVPYFQIKDIVEKEQITLFSSNFTLYRDLSMRVMRTLGRLVPTLEQYSIDEAFFTLPPADHSTLSAQLQLIKRTVETEIGIPVSVGLSDTKTRAKLVNAEAKRGQGVAMRFGEEVLSLYGHEPIAAVWGVGRRLTVRYTQAGINTIADLAQTPQTKIAEIGQTMGLRLWHEIRGQSCYPVSAVKEWPQSMMSSRSFGQKTSVFSLIADATAYHVRQIMADLRSEKLFARHLTVFLQTSRHGDWVLRGGVDSIDFVVPTQDTTLCLKAALQLLETLYEPDVPYNKVGVRLSGLYPNSFIPRSLFSNQVNEESTTPKTTLDSVVDKINQRFGQSALRQGLFVKHETWLPKRERLSPNYTTQWGTLPTVKAD